MVSPSTYCLLNTYHLSDNGNEFNLHKAKEIKYERLGSCTHLIKKKKGKSHSK